MKLECCPHCGSDFGLFSKRYVKYEQYYKFDGDPDGHSELWPTDATYRRKTTPLYCLNCGKRVTTLEKLEMKEGGSE